MDSLCLLPSWLVASDNRVMRPQPQTIEKSFLVGGAITMQSTKPVSISSHRGESCTRPLLNAPLTLRRTRIAHRPRNAENVGLERGDGDRHLSLHMVVPAAPPATQFASDHVGLDVPEDSPGHSADTIVCRHSAAADSTSCPVSFGASLSFQSPPQFRLPPASGMTQIGAHPSHSRFALELYVLLSFTVRTTH